MLPLPLGCENHKTYVLQFQKDKIYRVPPPRNALIIERHQNSPSVTNKERQCCPCLFLTISLFLLAIVIIIATTLTILYFIFNPNTKPAFCISNFVVMNPIDKISQPHYQIYLLVKNPNKRLGIEYQKDAEVLILYEKTKVAIGKFPWLELNPNDSNKVRVDLSGTRGTLSSHSMDKSKNGRKYNIPLALDLKLKLKLKTKAAKLWTWVVKCNVGCTFKVSMLRNEIRVLSQECQTNFKQS